MPRIPGLRRIVHSVVRRPSAEREVDDELAFHFAMKIDELTARGLSRAEAEREAERAFGDVAEFRRRLARIDREHRARRDWWERFDGVRQDARYALRGLRRSPGFTIGVVLTLALGIGANAAIFTLLDRLLLRPPEHVVAPDELRRVYGAVRFRGSGDDWSSQVHYPLVHALRTSVEGFASTGLYSGPEERPLGRGPDAATVQVMLADAGYFRTLGTRPGLGRFLVEEDDRDDAGTLVAIISHRLWQSRFGGAREVLGTEITLGSDRATIVGVAPPRFSGVEIDAPDAWIPLNAAIARMRPGEDWRADFYGRGLWMIGRLAPGADERAMETRATEEHRRLIAGSRFRDAPVGIRLGSIIRERGPARVGTDVGIATRIGGATLLVLLIACANVANLLLVRGMARRREIAVRLALGVSRGRLVAQLLVESLLLALIGGAVGLLVAWSGGLLLRALLFDWVHWATSPVDMRIVGFAILASVVTGVLAGLVPALRATRTDVSSALKAGSRDAAHGRAGLRGTLLVLQAAFAAVLLVGAGLFVRSLDQVSSVQLGFDRSSVYFARPGFERGTSIEARVAASRAVAERLAREPGVDGIALASGIPLYSISFDDLEIPGRDSVFRRAGKDPFLTYVSPGYHALLGTRLLEGRDFGDGDRAGSPRVAIVSRSFANVAWPGERPLGKCIRIGGARATCSEIVGVVEDRRSYRVDAEPDVEYFAPIAQAEGGWRAGMVVVRSRRAPAALTAALRRAIVEAAPLAVRAEVTPIAERWEEALRPWRTGSLLFGGLGALALVVAAVGLYAVVAFGVAQRTREFGIRTALGAHARDVVRSVLGEGVRLVSIGIAIGIAISLAAAKLVASLLYGITPRDPMVYVSAAAVLLAAAVVAAWFPARRAARVDPLVALRTE